MQAQSLVFLMHNILLWGKKKNTVKFQFAYSSFGFSWPWISLVIDLLCMCCRHLVLQLHRYALPPFLSRSTFVIPQVEQHALELFKAACTFCIKNMKKKEKKQRDKRLFNNVC